MFIIPIGVGEYALPPFQTGAQFVEFARTTELGRGSSPASPIEKEAVNPDDPRTQRLDRGRCQRSVFGVPAPLNAEAGDDPFDKRLLESAWPGCQ